MKKSKEIQSGWAKETKQDYLLKVMLFIISPFISMLYSIKNINTKSSFVVLYLYCLFFGMSFTTTSGKTDLIRSDSASYRLRFDNWPSYYTVDDYFKGLFGFFKLDPGSQDYFFETIAFAVTRLTENYHYFFLVIAAIYAFFMLKSLRYLVTLKEFKVGVVGLILVYFFLDKGIFNINGVRFWTAYWIAIFSLFKIYIDNNRKYYLLAMITPFFHGAYWLFFVIVLLHQLFRNKQKIIISFFIFSMFFGLISIQFINVISDYLPLVLQKLVSSYTDEEYIDLRNVTGGFGWWIKEILTTFKLFLINLLIYLFILNKNKILNKDKYILTFIILWVAIFNMFISVPSLGWRFLPIAYPFIAYLWFKVFGTIRYRYVVLLLPLAFFWDLIDYSRRIGNHIPLDIFYQSPIILTYKYLII